MRASLLALSALIFFVACGQATQPSNAFVGGWEKDTANFDPQLTFHDNGTANVSFLKSVQNDSSNVTIHEDQQDHK